MADDTSTSEQIRYRINDDDAASILTMAAIFDGLSFIPVVNVVIALVGQPIMFLMFWSKGVLLLGPKTWVWFVVSFIIEIIPVFSAFPTFTLSATRYIAISRVADRAGTVGSLIAKNKVRRFGIGLLQDRTTKEGEELLQRKAAASTEQQSAQPPGTDSNSGVRTSSDSPFRSTTRTERHLGNVNEFTPQQLRAMQEWDQQQRANKAENEVESQSTFAIRQPTFIGRKAPDEAPEHANDNDSNFSGVREA